MITLSSFRVNNKELILLNILLKHLVLKDTHMETTISNLKSKPFNQQKTIKIKYENFKNKTMIF